MAWRLQLADYAITAVYLLAGDPGLVAVFCGPRIVHYFDKANGAFYGSAHLDLPPSSEPPLSDAWRAFLDGLRAPDGNYLPCAYFGSGTVYLSHDGRVQLMCFDDGRLVLDADGQTSLLAHPETGVGFNAAALDRELGTLAALDDDGQLHLFQQHIAIGSYEVGDDTAGTQTLILLHDAADRVVIATPVQLHLIDMAGRKLACAAIPDFSGAAACSPDGQLVTVAESALDRITVFDSLLHPTWRGSVVDLLADAAPAQLIEEPGLRPSSAMPVAVDNDGLVAFAWGGWVCVSSLAKFEVLPRPQRLL